MDPSPHNSPQVLFFDKNFLHHSWIEVSYQQVHICNLHLFTFPFNICYFITNFQVCH